MLSRLLYIFLGFFIAIGTFAQEDTEFWFVAPDASRNHGDRPIYLVISSLAFETYVQITMPANDEFETIAINLPPNTTKLIDLSRRLSQVENAIHTSSDTYNPFSNKGIQIKATAPVKAYYEVSSGNNPEMFSLKGKNALGTHFFTVFQQEANNAANYYDQAYAGFHIVAVKNNTSIQITPTAHLIGNEKVYPKGETFTVVLNRGETFLGVPATMKNGFPEISQEGPDHPTGTEVKSNKPVAMTLHDCSVRGLTGGCLDIRGDQNIPVHMLGKEYIAMKGQGRTVNGVNEERIYILALTDNEKIYINGVYRATLNRGQQYVAQVDHDYMHIRSEDSTIYVMQVSGQKCEMGAAILPTTSSCTGSFEVAFTRTGKGDIYLNLMVIKGAEGSFLFNGEEVPWLDASLFESVPGDDRWVALKTGALNSFIQMNKNSVITNTKDLFHLGLINTNAAGTKFGYFSNFNEFTTNVINTKNGENYVHACYGKPVTFLSTSGMSEYNSEGLKYLWSTGDTTASIQVSPSVDSTFSVTVTLDNDCNMQAVDSGSMTVSEPIYPSATPEDTLVCIYEPVLLTAAGSDHFFWSHGAEGDSVEVKPAHSQMYYVSVTDVAGCYELDSVYVEVHPIPDLVLPDTIQACEGDTVVLDTKLDPSYELYWENGDTSKIRTVYESGMYSFYVIGEAGCLVPDTVDVIYHDYPEVKITNDTIICRGGSIRLNASGGEFYQWSVNNRQHPALQVDPQNPTTYYVTVSNFTCESYASVHVDIYDSPKLLLSSDSNVVCMGDSVFMSPSFGEPLFWWIDEGWVLAGGEPHQVIFPKKNRMYGLLVEDANDCRSYIYTDFVVHSLPATVYNGQTLQACENEMIPLVTSYSPSYSYLWSDGTESYINETQNTGWQTVSITSEMNCSSKDSVFIDRHPYPYVEIGNDTTVCSGEELQLSTYFDPSYTYSWSSGDQTPQIDIIVEQDMSYVVSVYGSYYCMASDTVYVSVEYGTPAGVIEGEDTVYVDKDFSIYNFNETPGNDYTWFLSDIYDTAAMPYGNTGASVIIDWRTVESDVYRLSVIEESPLANCATENEKEIYVASLPVVEIATMPISCFNANDGKAEASVSNGIPPFSYDWSNGEYANTLQRQDEITSLHEGAYGVTVSDHYGKQAFASVSIENPPVLSIAEIQKQSIRCYNGSDGTLRIIPEGGTPGYDFYWQHTNNTNAYQSGLFAGTYYVTVYDHNHCAVDTAITLNEPEPLEVGYDIVHPYCSKSEDGRIRLRVNGGNPFDDGGEPYYSYNWSVPSDANADSLDGLDPGVYFYTVTDKSGCHVRDSILLIAEQDICIDIPSAFTPNGDGVNDIWEIRYIDAYYPNAKMEIFDRYGRLVYVSSRGYMSWDGRKDGKFVAVDSYYYVLTFVDTEGYTTGVVTVIY